MFLNARKLTITMKIILIGLLSCLNFLVLLPDIKVQAEANYELNLQKNMIEITHEEKTWLLPEAFLQNKTEQKQRNFPVFEDIQAAQYIVTDMETGEILLEKGAEEQAYPASMTKILTAITVIESPDFDLEKPVILSEYALDLPSPESVRSDYGVGTQITTSEALHLLMVASANDCAKALAETYGGSEENFVFMMNEKAKEIGATGTNMVDASGFGLEDHYFTPSDLAKIIQYSMQNEVFQELVSTKQYIVERNVPTSEWGIFNNSNKLLLLGDSDLESPYLHTYDGVKTGTTDIAGYCLAATVHTYDGRHLCGIIFNGYLEGQAGASNTGMLLRGILEEAVIKAGSPSKTEVYAFLGQNPDILQGINHLTFENTLDDFVEHEFLDEEEKNEILATEEMTEEIKETGNLIDNLLGRNEAETELPTINTSSISGSENDQENMPNGQGILSKFQNNSDLLMLGGLAFVLVISMIILILMILKHKNKK